MALKNTSETLQRFVGRRARQGLLLSFVSILAVGPKAFSQQGESKPAPAKTSPAAKPTAPAPTAKTNPSASAPAVAKPAAPNEKELAAAQLLKLEDQFKQNPGSLKAIHALAAEYQKQGQQPKATKLLWSQIKILDRKGMILLINAHEANSEWGEVIRAGNLLLSKNANDEEALTRIGNAQFMRKKTGAAKTASESEAKESLKKAVEINPKYQPAYEALAKIYEKNPYELRELYQDMIRELGPRADTLTKLCGLNTVDGENEQGEQDCSQAIVANPKTPDNHVNLGIIAKQKGEPEKAKKLLRAAAEKFPQSEFAQYEAGQFSENEKNWIDAYKYYAACVIAEPTSERCLGGVGNSGVQIQEYDKALSAFKLVCRKSGRKYAPIVRRATTTLQSRKDGEWARKFEALAERCAYQ